MLSAHVKIELGASVQPPPVNSELVIVAQLPPVTNELAVAGAQLHPATNEPIVSEQLNLQTLAKHRSFAHRYPIWKCLLKQSFVNVRQSPRYSRAIARAVTQRMYARKYPIWRWLLKQKFAREDWIHTQKLHKMERVQAERLLHEWMLSVLT